MDLDAIRARVRGAAESDECICPVGELCDEGERLRAALIAQSATLEQVLGKALGYPRYSDDQKNFPGATGDAVCVGEMTAEMLADEAAAYIKMMQTKCKMLEAKNVALRRRLERLPGTVDPMYVYESQEGE